MIDINCDYVICYILTVFFFDKKLICILCEYLKVLMFIINWSYLILIMLIVSCAKGSSTYSTVDSESYSYYLPQSLFPFELKIANVFTTTEQTQLNSMMNEWEIASKVNFFTSATEIENLSFTNIIDYYNLDELNNGVYLNQNQMENISGDVLAICQLIVRLDFADSFKYYRIIHADIIFNGFDYNFNDGGGGGGYDLQTIFLHELGHVLGLLDSDYGIMTGYISSYEVKRSVDPETTNLIKAKYDGERNPIKIMNNKIQDRLYRVLFFYRADKKIESFFEKI